MKEIKNDQILNDLFKTINMFITERIKELSYCYCVPGQVQQANADNTYDCLINKSIQKVYAINDDIRYKRGDTVLLLVINNDYSQKMILCKKPKLVL